MNMIKPSTLRSKERIVVFDTETTGFSNSDRIIEFGAVEIINGQPRETFQAYIRPPIRVPKAAIDVHGITNEFLSNMPPFSSVFPSIYDFIRGSRLVAHNAKFDIRMMRNECRHLDIELPIEFENVIDTMELAAKKWPGKRASLDAMLDRLGISRSGRILHGALLDSQLLAEAFLALDKGQIALNIKAGTAVVTRASAARTVAPLPLVKLCAADIDMHNAYVSNFAKNATLLITSQEVQKTAPSKNAVQDDFSNLVF